MRGLVLWMLLAHRDLAGVHFTGSTFVFNNMWKTIGANMSNYASYPRIVGETGGKDFIVAHPSADAQAVAVAIARGAFEYQGQKCSAASRVYIPRSLWPQIRDSTVAMMETMRMGDVRDFRNFMGAVIDEKSFRKISGYLEDAKQNATKNAATTLQSTRRGVSLPPIAQAMADTAAKAIAAPPMGDVDSVRNNVTARSPPIVPIWRALTVAVSRAFRMWTISVPTISKPKLR